MNKIKVCLTSIWYPLSMSRYFERALERREDVELVTLGPYTGSWIPWAGGMNLLPKYDKSPTHPLPREFIIKGQVDPHIFFVFEDLADVDLWLEVDAGFFLNPKPKSGIVAHVATDPHCLNYDRQRILADYFFNMQSPYQKKGDIYLPYAYDPIVHYPMDIPKEYDACIIGLHYPQRTDLVNRLLSNGLKVHYSIGEVYDEYRIANNKSRIGLNWSSMQDLNARAWELAAMGLCSVQNIVPDMATFFVDGEHYLGFNNIDEAEKQVMKAMADEEMRKEIGDAARRKVLPHTYDARIQQILETVKLI